MSKTVIAPNPTFAVYNYDRARVYHTGWYDHVAQTWVGERTEGCEFVEGAYAHKVALLVTHQ